VAARLPPSSERHLARLLAQRTAPASAERTLQRRLALSALDGPQEALLAASLGRGACFLAGTGAPEVRCFETEGEEWSPLAPHPLLGDPWASRRAAVLASLAAEAGRAAGEAPSPSLGLLDAVLVAGERFRVVDLLEAGGEWLALLAREGWESGCTARLTLVDSKGARARAVEVASLDAAERCQGSLREIYRRHRAALAPVLARERERVTRLVSGPAEGEARRLALLVRDGAGEALGLWTEEEAWDAAPLRPLSALIACVDPAVAPGGRRPAAEVLLRGLLSPFQINSGRPEAWEANPLGLLRAGCPGDR
jgi:hypothetical protein